jgi:ribonuclease D|tara:strand:+ start:387 stop:710 length:324 start_codon:yes stop_codon:yes gene_type:complete
MTKTQRKQKDKSRWRCSHGRCTCVHDQEESERLQRTPLYKTLNKWRSQQAKKDGLKAPHMVLEHQTMMQIVMKEPKTDMELLLVKGIAEIKQERYGTDIIFMVELLA